MTDDLKRHEIRSPEPGLTRTFTSRPSRFEFKYLITEPQARRFVKDVEPFCRRDEFLSNGETMYTISSLYLDSPGLDIYWEKKLLQYTRMKARIRTYGPRSEGPVYLELKRRFGEVMVKTRCKVFRDRWTLCVDHPQVVEPASMAVDSRKPEMVEDFCLEVARHNLRPLVVVRYEREPFVGRYDKGIRVTFDRRLRYAPVTEASLAPDDASYLPFDFAECFGHPESRVILELKFTGGFPDWMQDLIERHEILRESFSKFARSVDIMLGESYTYNPAAWKSVVV